MSCTRLWKELTDRFTSLEKDLYLKSEPLRLKIQSLDNNMQLSLASLHYREQTLNSSIVASISKVEDIKEAALAAGSELDPDDLVRKLRFLWCRMDFEGFQAGEVWSWGLDKAVKKEKAAQAAT